MKWDKPNGSRQGSACGKYVIVQATENNWIAYALTPFATGDELGVKSTDEEARRVCDDHEREMTALRRAG